MAEIPERRRVATTPHREVLIRRAHDAFDHERLHFEARREHAARRLANAAARHEEANRRLSAARRALAGIPVVPDAATLLPRRPGEDRHTSLLVRTRRSREHHRRRRRAEAVVSRAQAIADRIARQQSDARAEIERERLVAQVRVRRIHEHTHCRLAAYRRKLVRVHRNGGWVNEVMDSLHPLLPGWTVRGAGDEPAGAAGGPGAWELPSEPGTVDVVEPVRGRPIRIGDVTRFGADQDKVDVHIRSGYGVAGLHATLRRRGAGYRLHDHHRGEGTFHDGEPVRWVELEVGFSFTIGDFRYRIVEKGLLEETQLGPSDLVVHRLCAGSGNPRTREREQRLTHMSFVQRAATVLAIIGPSGAGKSSFFHALLGELEPSEGSLFFSRMDVRAHPQQLRPKLGFVPQEDHLFHTLTVRQLLSFSDRLRRPRDRSAGRGERIVQICRELSIEDRVDRPIATLSGGQRKRVSIALEMLAEPGLLLLDEPTSGLDPARDKEVMRILAARAARGCTVLVVTHSTLHLGLADQVLVVAAGGRPVHLGPAAGVTAALGGGDHADVMERLSADPEIYATAYQNGPATAEAGRTAAALRAELDDAEPATGPMRGRAIGPSLTRQLAVLVHRQVALLLTRGPVRHARTWPRRMAGLLVVLMPLVVASLGTALAAVVVDDTGLAGAASAPTGLSLLVTLTMLGAQALTYSDVVAEYPMIHREHRTGLRVLAVVGSKWLVYAAVAVAQAAIVVAVFSWIRPGPPRGVRLGPGLEMFVNLAALGVAAMSLGLLISVVAKKLEQAVAIATATAIAQVALSGAMADLTTKPLPLQALAVLLPTRWGYAASAASIDLGTTAPQVIDDPWWRHHEGQWLVNLSALGALTVVFTMAAVLLLRRRLDRQES